VTTRGQPADIGAASLEALIKAQGYALGFDLVGITTLGPVESNDKFEAWLARGYAGEMSYLERGAEKRRDSSTPWPGARSAIVVAMDYGGQEPPGPVARYARGDDYHDVMTDKLRALSAWLDSTVGRPISAKAYVDTGPILERDLAQKAGLGWIGKNTNLLNPQIGSFFFLGSLLLDLALDADAPFTSDHCGTCRRCIEACPTDAIVDDRVLDATRCISYLTIEQRGAIPEALRPLMGDLIYGCDICQSCCPWNVRFSQGLSEPSFAPREVLAGADAGTLARELLAMSPDEFSVTFKGSAMKRAKLRGLKRNAAVALGNVGTADDRAVLEQAIDDPDPLVSEHAAWALHRLVTSH
jgi:epoxyqueuosine reductase